MRKTPSSTKISPIVAMLAQEAKRQNLTAYGLAATTGLSIPTITRVLTGTASPTLASIEVIAKALGMVVKLERR